MTINLHNYFTKLKAFQVIGDMTGWTPTYLNSRNELWFVDPSKNDYFKNFEHIDNMFKNSELPLYCSILGCDTNDESDWLEDFEITYKNDIEHEDRVKLFRLYTHPTKKENEWETKNAWLVGDGIFDYDNLGLPLDLISSINLTARGWMYTYYIFENYYFHPWENTDFGKLPRIPSPNKFVIEKMFKRITEYFTNSEVFDNAVFKFGKDNFLYVDWPDLISNENITNKDLYKLYHTIYKIENPFQQECYYDKSFEMEREKLFNFLNSPEIQEHQKLFNEILLDSDYYKEYSSKNIVNSLNYQNIKDII